MIKIIFRQDRRPWHHGNKAAIAGALIAYVANLLFLRRYPREAVAESDRRRAARGALYAVGVFAMMVAGFWVAYRLQITVF